MVSILRAALCDDEQSWLDVAERILRDYAQQAGLTLELSTYHDRIELLEQQAGAPDVLFSDIELGEDESGIDLVRLVAHRWPRCQIVYVTNFLRYAPEVYVTEHLWFVLKERFADRLPEIMDKLERQMDDDGRVLMVETTGHEMASLPCPQIVSMERRGRTTLIKTAEGTCYQVPDRLPALLDRLPGRVFVRCHASFAVNLNHVRIVRADTMVLDDGSIAPISRRFARGFRNHYLDWADDHAV